MCLSLPSVLLEVLPFFFLPVFLSNITSCMTLVSCLTSQCLGRLIYKMWVIILSTTVKQGVLIRIKWNNTCKYHRTVSNPYESLKKYYFSPTFFPQHFFKRSDLQIWGKKNQWLSIYLCLEKFLTNAEFAQSLMCVIFESKLLESKLDTCYSWCFTMYLLRIRTFSFLTTVPFSQSENLRMRQEKYLIYRLCSDCPSCSTKILFFFFVFLLFLSLEI